MTPPRTGPRPLGLHLTSAGAISASSLSAWTLLRSGWTPWSGSLAAAGKALQRDLAAADPEAFADALTRELARRHDAYLTGLETYRAHAWRRSLDAPPPLWKSGPVQLRDYGVTHPDGASGRPLLVVPSLINRGYILDLTAERSFLRFLAGKGFRPLLVDWGTPDAAWLERSLDDIVADDLGTALDVAVETAGGDPVPVLGYCMGGTMTVALAACAAAQVSALVLLAAPWDFHAETGGPPPFVTVGRPALERVLSTMGCLPVDVLQSLFFAVDPVQSWAKFRAIGTTDRESRAVELFVALEDWVNDGVPLGAAVARECLFGWYGDNAPARGRWTVRGTPVDPAAIEARSLVVVPGRDRIVPPAAARTLADRIPDSDVLEPDAGHIGMMVGGKAERILWTPVRDWLAGLRGEL